MLQMVLRQDKTNYRRQQAAGQHKGPAYHQQGLCEGIIDGGKHCDALVSAIESGLQSFAL